MRSKLLPGGTLQLDACDGQIDAALGPILAREIAVANVQAVVSTQALCESSGGPGTMACGLTMGTVTDIAKAQVLTPNVNAKVQSHASQKTSQKSATQ